MASQQPCALVGTSASLLWGASNIEFANGSDHYRSDLSAGQKFISLSTG